MNSIGIEQLSLFGMPPVQSIELVADLGCRKMSWATTSFPYEPAYFPAWSLRDDVALRREMVAALRDRGVAISLAEGFSVRPGVDVREARADDIAIFGELGAERINMVSFDPDMDRTLDQFGALVEMAAAAGMEATVEFSPSDGKSVRDLETALVAIRHVGRPDFRLLIDTMHLVRSGGGAGDLAALDAGLIGYAQLCDGPAIQRFASYMEEALYERMVPGTGELPLIEILSVLPEDIVISLEVPQRSLIDAGVDASSRLAPCVEAAHRLLEQAWVRKKDIRA